MSSLIYTDKDGKRFEITSDMYRLVDIVDDMLIPECGCTMQPINELSVGDKVKLSDGRAGIVSGKQELFEVSMRGFYVLCKRKELERVE